MRSETVCHFLGAFHNWLGHTHQRRGIEPVALGRVSLLNTQPRVRYVQHHNRSSTPSVHLNESIEEHQLHQRTFTRWSRAGDCFTSETPSARTSLTQPSNSVTRVPFDGDSALFEMRGLAFESVPVSSSPSAVTRLDWSTMKLHRTNIG